MYRDRHLAQLQREQLLGFVRLSACLSLLPASGWAMVAPSLSRVLETGAHSSRWLRIECIFHFRIHAQGSSSLVYKVKFIWIFRGRGKWQRGTLECPVPRG